MVYLKKFNLLNDSKEHNVMEMEERRIFNNNYPLRIFPPKGFENIEFENITIFYGTNGSGKSTLINIIADKLGAIKKEEINRNSFFNLYVKFCNYEMGHVDPVEIKLITSDDVFEYLLDIRYINGGINRQKERLSKEYLNYKFNNFNDSIDNYNEIKNNYDSKSKSISRYIRDRLSNNNIIEQSNGESALLFWEKEIKQDGIYILDEPENSLSAENQLKLKKFIEDSARFFNCQFIISTHSPFLLNLSEAKIYDLDEVPVISKKWTELPNVRLYYDFFKEKEKEFE